MAFGTLSKIFPAWVRDSINNTAAHSGAILTDQLNIALYNNTNTPDQFALNTLTGYNQATSQWVAANEVTATGWPAGGLALASVASSFTTNVYTLTAANRAGGATDTVTNAFGCLIFNNAITTFKDGICYLAFGGANSVVSGTFTVQFNAAGILTLTV